MITRRVDQPLSRHLCFSSSRSMFLFLHRASHPSLSFPLGPSNFSLSSLQLYSIFLSLFLSMSIFFFIFFVLSLFLRHLLFSELFRPLRSYQSLAKLFFVIHSFTLFIYSLHPFLHTMSVPTSLIKFFVSSLFCVFLSILLIFFFVSLLYFFHEIPSVFLDAYNFLLLSLFLRIEVGVDLISPHLCVRYLAPCLPTIVADSLRVTTSVSFMQLPMGRERV